MEASLDRRKQQTDNRPSCVIRKRRLCLERLEPRMLLAASTVPGDGAMDRLAIVAALQQVGVSDWQETGTELQEGGVLDRQETAPVSPGPDDDASYRQAIVAALQDGELTDLPAVVAALQNRRGLAAEDTAVALSDSMALSELYQSGLEVISSGPTTSMRNYKSDPTVLKDGHVYKMWYGANRWGGGQQIFYATSPDGVHWEPLEQPVVELGDRGEWDAGDVETPTVVKTGNTYHMWYSGRATADDPDQWSAETAYQIGHAISSDGIHWSKDQANPVLRLGNWEQNEWNWAAVTEPSVVYSERQGQPWFEMWYVGANVIEGSVHVHVGYATSTDGSSWRNHSHNPVIESLPSPQDAEYNGFFTPCVVKDGSRYLMLYTNDTWNGQPAGPIRVASSQDGVHWLQNKNSLIEKGDAGSWNSAGVFGPTVVPEPEAFHIWYTGFQVEAGLRFGIGYSSIERAAAE